MGEHPNVTLVDRMTKAAMEGDKKVLAACFTEDLVVHIRGTLPHAGDHRGVTGFLDVIGTIMELTGGEVKLDQLVAAGTDGWAALRSSCSMAIGPPL